MVPVLGLSPLLALVVRDDLLPILVAILHKLLWSS